ncbi:MAG TPA: GDSL-type esterase/lipase family protein [Acidisarcina sp.]
MNTKQAAAPTNQAAAASGREAPSGPTQVACVGDSITAGAGIAIAAVFSYPAQLQRALGTGWNVTNFGVNGATLLRSGDIPYQRQDAFAAALRMKPDVVVIMLGTNDSKPKNWRGDDQFVVDYIDLIEKFELLASKIYLCLPAPSVGGGNYAVSPATIVEELPLIRELASSRHLGLVDVHSAFAGKEVLFSDRVHPTREGAGVIARTVYQAVTRHEYSGPATDTFQGILRGMFSR